MNIQMVDLQGQYQRLKEEIDRRIHKVLDTSYFVGGPEVANFSKNLANYLDVEHLIPCGNGTDALQVALMALDLSPGDEIITTPFTFVATAEVVKLLHLKVVFADIDPVSFNIDPNSIRKVVSPKTKCIIPVHLFGQSADMTEIMEIAEEFDIKVIEDNAQAIGAYYEYKGKKVATGTIGHIGTTSFFPSKNLGCYGDGGAIMTRDEALGTKIRLIANHGSKVKYYYESIGVNSRLDAIQAVVLDTKLKHLDDFGKRRKEAAKVYDALFKNNDLIKTPVVLNGRDHVFHQYTIRVSAENRERLVESFKDSKIPFGIYYPSSLHTQQAYLVEGVSLPESEKASLEVFSLPMHTELTLDQQEYVANTVLKSIK